MKNKYKYNIPHYKTEMNALVGKLAPLPTTDAKVADQALDEALVHARNVAHASAYTKLHDHLGLDCARNDAEDISQSVMAGLLTPKSRATLIKNVSKSTNVEDRKRLFGTTIKRRIVSEMRRRARKMQYRSLDELMAHQDSDQGVAMIDTITDKHFIPSQTVAQIDRINDMVQKIDNKWQSTNASRKVHDWSPTQEILGFADRRDRPSEEVVPNSTLQGHKSAAIKVVERYRKRQEFDGGPAL